MSYSPESNHPRDQQASSPPDLGTPTTYYSPEFLRGKQVATGKLPVIVSSQRLQPTRRTEAKFVNELVQGTDEYISRYISILSFPDGRPAGVDQDSELHELLSRMKEYSVFNNAVPLWARGVYIRFDSLRDSCDAKYLFSSLHYATEYISPYEYAVAKSQDTIAVNDYEGQVVLALYIESVDVNDQGRAVKGYPETPLAKVNEGDLDEIAMHVQTVTDYYGPTRDIEHVSTDESRGLVRYRVEFQSINDANRAMQSLKLMTAMSYSKNMTFRWGTVIVGPWVGPPRNDSPQSKTPQKDDQGRLVGFLHQKARHIPTSSYLRHPADQHNKVQRERIERGTDVRTTVMLRNIPNKLDWMSLKALLDKECFGCYDFVYLRIDFKSACNVGYAFINFTDMRGMLQLVNELEHRTWHGYRSAKSAEVSYATIQGKEALVQKFRNSSVMQETPFCRPRLFMSTVDGIEVNDVRAVGREIAFPIPDNQAKLQRSMDSARTVGLYPPHGSGVTYDHRNRSSAYDRGTPRDLVESAAALQNSFNGPFSYDQVPPQVKRMIEQWYGNMFGKDHHCPVPYDYIPISCVTDYFAMTPYAANQFAPAQNPGVIGQTTVAANQVIRHGPVYAVAGPSRPYGGYRPNGY
ncbi:hypothetical protein K504DRAFT_445767 [Pleomassaria siparia CBS 279.74]|uniref:RRM domain-containing protein n=1 Tax=Pleomassaria siparia CBS 279.74 TaxID=1314801 RepID=A0A6G1KPR3_9PLEO|nr:hypothetical protein K504DRAFT_445767 [Pleomassaria siparia CBS 279.74]